MWFSVLKEPKWWDEGESFEYELGDTDDLFIQGDGETYDYTVRNKIWEESGLSGAPPIEKLEEAIGRTLVLEDFDSTPNNWLSSRTEGQSPKKFLESRIGKDGIKRLIEIYVEECRKTNPENPKLGHVGVPAISEGRIRCVFYGNAQLILNKWEEFW